LGYSTNVTTKKATNTTSGALDDGMERGALTLETELASSPACAGNTTPGKQDWGLHKESAYRQVSVECSEGSGDEPIIQEYAASSNSPPVVVAGSNGMRNPSDSLHNHQPHPHNQNNQHHQHHHHANHFGHEDEDEETEHANLNMCSAYTHVFADTLRSIAVIVASGVADVVDGVTPEEADAAAAVVVSILVLLSMVPLFHGLVQSVSELRAILFEEESEKMFPGHANATTELN
jgi:hypothetical protein